MLFIFFDQTAVSKTQVYLGFLLFVCLLFFLQLIQTISAVDKDDPLGGQKFFFSLAAVNPNFTVQDNEGKIHACSKEGVLSLLSGYIPEISLLLMSINM